MAWIDWMYTGNLNSIWQYYDVLKSKTLADHAREDGLLNTKELQDNVDWPKCERDNYEFREVNTVMNAFYYKTLGQMSEMARAIGKSAEAKEYEQKATAVKEAFNRVFFDVSQGIYLDGEDATHASLHANMWSLAFGLVPEDRKQGVVDFVIAKGMACSVYAAQYLLEALYEAGRPDIALERMTATDLRSWYNMLRVGSTITLEAWDNQFKPNQDWNHAWGAAPGNIIPRYLMGIRPLEPGFSKVLIQPQPASLKSASITIPSIRGPISVSFENNPPQKFTMQIEIPVNVVAKVGIPQYDLNSHTLVVDGKETHATVSNGYLFIDLIGSGFHRVVLSH
jgi:hypothetical protein